jgi:hypothetical protein
LAVHCAKTSTAKNGDAGVNELEVTTVAVPSAKVFQPAKVYPIFCGAFGTVAIAVAVVYEVEPPLDAVVAP